ncbi:MAG: carboxylesterase [Steroidobacteraceae bacterium]
MLETIDIETRSHPDAAIIWLHGLGADAHDFEPVVPEIVGPAGRRPGERAWRFVFPNAPIRPVTLNNGMRMRAWYDIRSLERGSAEDIEGFRTSMAQVIELITREKSRGIPPERLVLAGFSQGGAVSLYTMSRLTERLAGVLALSCYVPASARLATERQAANDATPIFMGHGQFDPLIAVDVGRGSRDLLARLGYAVQWHDYPMAHSVCMEEIADIRQFLLKVLP